MPIVVLEPSCASVFRDELRNLFPADARADRLRKQTFLLSEFLERHAPDFQPPRLERSVLLHGHCHHKALMKMTDEESLLKKMGAQVTAPDAGCCGMAGPFGFDADKYDVSMAIGERVLLPAVRNTPSDTLIVSDGFSCREQIYQATGRKALHLAEVMQLALDNEERKRRTNKRRCAIREAKSRVVELVTLAGPDSCESRTASNPLRQCVALRPAMHQTLPARITMVLELRAYPHSAARQVRGG